MSRSFDERGKGKKEKEREKGKGKGKGLKGSKKGSQNEGNSKPIIYCL